MGSQRHSEPRQELLESPALSSDTVEGAILDVLLILKALILGLVEAASEFLPISSTGHLIIVGDFLDFTGPRAESLEIFSQVEAI